jgi:hypothetical protein
LTIGVRISCCGDGGYSCSLSSENHGGSGVDALTWRFVSQPDEVKTLESAMADMNVGIKR